MHSNSFKRWCKTGVFWMIVTGILTPTTVAAVNPLECREWFEDAEQALRDADIRDAGARRIESYPHLRVTRRLAAIRPASNREAAGKLWLELLADEALSGWRSELLRLPESAPLEPRDRSRRIERMEACVQRLVEMSTAAGVPELKIPDAYAGWMRALGVYPVTRWLATPFVNRYREDMAARLEAEPPEPRMLFTPPELEGDPPYPAALPENTLELPLPGSGAREAMLTHYAPVLAVARTDPANLPGTVGLSNGRAEVLTRTTTAYQWVSWTRFRGEYLLQLNYQFWFSKRPEEGQVDPYAGRLDGLIWRITLQPNGHVLAYDSIHPCGCYHKVYPVSAELQPRHPDQAGQPVFYPDQALNARTERIQLTLEPDTHYIVDVDRVTETGLPARQYRLRDAERLRHLPDGPGYGSLYDRNGFVPGTRRSEHWLLWPLGVPSAGAMRQPGHHAIAFIGKRHFDDPAVLEDVLEPRPFLR